MNYPDLKQKNYNRLGINQCFQIFAEKHGLIAHEFIKLIPELPHTQEKTSVNIN